MRNGIALNPATATLEAKRNGSIAFKTQGEIILQPKILNLAKLLTVRVKAEYQQMCKNEQEAKIIFLRDFLEMYFLRKFRRIYFTRTRA